MVSISGTVIRDRTGLWVLLASCFAIPFCCVYNRYAYRTRRLSYHIDRRNRIGPCCAACSFQYEDRHQVYDGRQLPNRPSDHFTEKPRKHRPGCCSTSVERLLLRLCSIFTNGRADVDLARLAWQDTPDAAEVCSARRLYLKDHSCIYLLY